MIALVDVGGRLTSGASKSQIIYAFLVPEGLEALEIHFSYSPKLLEDRERARGLVALAAPRFMEEPQLSKYLERWERVLPLQNLLTLSLDDLYRFRGAAHRHTPVQEHRLGANDAEPGFLQGPIVAGMWRITVSVHAIVTEVCSYELKVNGVEKERSHIKILTGLEWTTFYGHMLVLGLPAGGYADWRMLGSNDLAQGLREVKALGALAGLAHPFRVGSPMCTGCYWEYSIDDWNAIDFIEVWSGTLPSVHSSNQRAFALWTEVLNQGYRVTATCGRDWHVSVPGAVDPEEPVSVTYVADGGSDPAAAIAAGEVTVTMGPLLMLTVGCSGTEEEGFVIGIGGTVPSSLQSGVVEACIRLDFDRRRTVWSLPEQTLEVRLFANDGIVATVSWSYRETSASVPIQAAGLKWLRAELYGTLKGCRTMIAFTNAIYFESESN